MNRQRKRVPYNGRVFNSKITTMDIASSSTAFGWVVSHGYFLIFLAMLLDSPTVTIAATFAAALGYFNIFVIFALSLLAELLADVIYYGAGHISRLALVEKYGVYIGLSKEKIIKIENLLHTHAVKTLIAIKLTPVLSGPGLAVVGASRLPLKKFAITALFIALPRTALFMLVGFSSGKAYGVFSAAVNNVELSLAFLILLLALAYSMYRLYRKITEKFSEKIEKI